MILTFTTEALDGTDNSVTLRFSDTGFSDGLYYYIPRIKNLGYVTISPNDGGVFSIFNSSSIGEISVINVDNSLDYLEDYAVDGRKCNIGIYGQTPYFYGTVERMVWSRELITFRLKSLTEAFSQTHPENKYLGNNVLPLGVEGLVDDIKGNIKPKSYGTCKQISPVLVNTSKLIYQVSENTDTSIVAVYEAGSPITPTVGAEYSSISDMETNAPAAGYWRSYKGYFRFGGSTLRTITVDTTSTIKLAGDVMEQIVVEKGYTMDSVSKSLMNAVGEIGIHKPDSSSTSSLLDRIAKSCGACWYFIEEVLYATPIALATTYAWKLYPYNISKFERIAVGGGSNGLPITKFTLECDEVITTQTDLAGAVSTTDKARLAEKFRKATSDFPAVLTRHPLAEKIEIVEGCLRTITSAQVVTNRLGNIFKNKLSIINVTANFTTLPNILRLFDGIMVYYDGMGFEGGKIMTITSYSIDVKKKQVELNLIG